ncbi:sigma-54-dependent transcriptional regulator [Desulfobacula phenolica]|uniref:Two-component system, NtrC family, response regulator AtoC n=1 Tax=Desulfobacula phenolica TaxID=90732 RepID=A0A1H2IUD4_9BACT|nr:sigma-54 dependent transcriptional regulator [Desulfobacula phenolica]SDU47794.1 two-component system, NtrC family, response regulator AtoC [Desulfobacula phenolica]
MESNVLVIDDQPSILESMNVFFQQRGWMVYTSLKGLKGLAMARKLKPDLVILDIKLPDIDGLVVLEKIKKEIPQTQVIIITAYQDMENTIASIKMGAFEFIHKPIDIHEMDAALYKLSKISGKGVDVKNQQIQGKRFNYDMSYIVGKSMAMKEVFKKIALVTDSRVTVLIQGESGTGKELIAKAIHFQGIYKKQPFIVMDCSTLVDTLAESELFGYEKGAFTGADSTFVGRLEKAGDGTIFFDEIGEMPLQTQSKLLRFLHEKEFVRVGSTKVIRSNARILAATNRELDTMMSQKSFREDLFHRLSVMTIHVPPLRDRKSDIPLLADYLIKKISAQTHMQVKSFDSDMLTHIFSRYDWPGNVRQLENTLTRAVLMAKSSLLTEEDLYAALGKISEKKQKSELFKPLCEVEKDYIIKVLDAFDWHFGKTCRILGITRPTLRSKLKKYNIGSKR